MKNTNILAILLAWIVSISPAQAGDYIIVVDASNSMRGPLPAGEVKETKKEMVEKQLKTYLTQIKGRGHRVQMTFFHRGIAKGFEYDFDKKGDKERALKDAVNYGEYFVIRDATFLWSSFNKALVRATNSNFYRPAIKDKDGRVTRREYRPHILLISDGLDIQTNRNDAWGYNERARLPGGARGLVKNVITTDHPWLNGYKGAKWVQLGHKSLVKWEGTSHEVMAEAPRNPVSLDLSELPIKKLPEGGSIPQATAKIPFKVTAVSEDERNKIIVIRVSINGGPFQAVGPDGTITAPKKGYLVIEAIPDDLSDLAAREEIEILASVPLAIDIRPAFKLLYNGKPVKNDAALWTGKGSLSFTLEDNTAVFRIVEGKEVKVPREEWPKNLQFVWEYNGKDYKYDTKLDAPVGGHMIRLKAKQDRAAGNAIGANAKNNEFNAELVKFTVKQIQILPSIKGVEKGKALTILKDQQVQFTLNFKGNQMPEGIVTEWDYGDGTPKGKLLSHKYKKASMPGKPFQPKVYVTLASGETLEEALPSIQVIEADTKATANPPDPWPGQKVAFTTPAKDVVKVTWIIGVNRIAADPDKNFAIDHAFDIPGQHEVKVEIMRKGLKEPLKTIVKVVVKDVDPKVEIINEGPTYIGQLIKLKITNAAVGKGAVQFPPGYKTDLIDGKGNKLDSNKVFFAKDGKHRIKALVTVPGAEKEFQSKEPAEIDVKPVVVDFELGPKK